MTYVEKTLGRGETIIAKAEVSKLPVVVWGIISIGLFFLTAAGFDFDISGMVAGLIIAVAVFSKPAITVFTTELSLTNRRIVGKTGFFKTKTLDFPIKKINSIYVEQKLFGKIFNYSTVNVSSASGVFQYNMVKNAENFRQIVSEQIDAYEVGGSVPSYSPVSDLTHKPENRCSSCGAVIAADAAFCPKCGQPTVIPKEDPRMPAKKTCPHCGASIDSDAVFCSSCGKDTRKKETPNPVPRDERTSPAPRKKRCVNCGNLVDQEAAFCPACGKKPDVPDTPSKPKTKPKGFSAPTDLD